MKTESNIRQLLPPQISDYPLNSTIFSDVFNNEALIFLLTFIHKQKSILHVR